MKLMAIIFTLQIDRDDYYLVIIPRIMQLDEKRFDSVFTAFKAGDNIKEQAYRKTAPNNSNQYRVFLNKARKSLFEAYDACVGCGHQPFFKLST